MVNYRRNFLPGGTFFFTATLKNRKSQLFLENIDLLRKSFKRVKQEKPFHVNAIAVLPEHIHTIWTLPTDDKDYATRWRMIKKYFTQDSIENGLFLKKDSRGSYPLWQPRYWEHTIRDIRDLENHVNYIHYNPVKHGLVSNVNQWPHSSFHRYVKQGFLPEDWGGDMQKFNGKYGE